MNKPVASEQKPRPSSEERFENASRVSRLFRGITFEEFTSFHDKVDKRFPRVSGQVNEFSEFKEIIISAWFAPQVFALLGVSIMRKAAALFGSALNIKANEYAKLHKPPGSLLLSVAELLYSKKNYEAVFCQLIADYREEYFEAAAVGKTSKKIFIVVRHWWAFAKATIKLTPIIGLAYSAIEKYGSE